MTRYDRGVAGGSSSQDQRLGAMGWQGLTSRAVKKKVAPPNINTAQQLNN